jgi:uncharacterized SAM-binding protein YcdF (DUF218 family)
VIALFHRRRRALIGGVICAVVVVATDMLFWSPASSRPRKADAVVVFGGAGAREAEGERLVREGIAPILAESVNTTYDPCYGQQARLPVICFRPQPLTTQGEARWLAATARARGWHHVVVVVSVPQATRARLRIRRCYSGGLQIVTVHLSVASMVANAVYEWGAMFKALTLQRGC